MQRKIYLIKQIILGIAKSYTINWILGILTILNLFTGWFGGLFNNIMVIVFWIELMLMDVNTHYYFEEEQIDD